MKQRLSIRKITALILGALLLLSLLPVTDVHALDIIYGNDASSESEETSSEVDYGQVPGGLTIDDSAEAAGQISSGTSGGNTSITIDYSANIRTASTSGTGSDSTASLYTVGDGTGPILAWLYLRTEGFSAASAAAVLGNIERDSNFYETSVGDNGSYGLFRLTGSSLEAMKDYCSAHGLDYADELAQVEAVISAVAPGIFAEYTGDKTVYSLTEDKEYDDGNHDNEAGFIRWYDEISLEDFKKLEDPQKAAEIWRRVMVRNEANTADIAMRKQMAQNYYDSMKDISLAGADVILEAVKYLGNPYVFGGGSLTNGIDCSHFVCSILENTGHYSGGYLNSAGLRSAGTAVSSLSDAEPGDVLCWDGHVAFYMTDGTIIHAKNPSSGITTDTGLDLQNYHGGLLTIRRFFE